MLFPMPRVLPLAVGGTEASQAHETSIESAFFP